MLSHPAAIASALSGPSSQQGAPRLAGALRADSPPPGQQHEAGVVSALAKK